jgi:hypothetical protein
VDPRSKRTASLALEDIIGMGHKTRRDREKRRRIDARVCFKWASREVG